MKASLWPLWSPDGTAPLAFLLSPLNLLAIVLLLATLFLLWLMWLRIKVDWGAEETVLGKELAGKETVAFFHPYAHAGGGGERVLWCSIKAVQEKHPGVVCVVYTGDQDVKPEDILEQAKKRFGVPVDPAGVRFAFLTGRRWVDARSWPRFTLIGQSIGSVMLGWEALSLFRPSIFIDSMGYAFTLPLFHFFGSCRTGCYVHYPTVSTDMLENVRSRSVAVNNNASVAASPTMSLAKLMYYKAFAHLYGIVGRFSEVVLVNSSWTRGHIDTIWKVPEITSIVFPPVNTADLGSLPLERAPKVSGGRLLLSLAQFRPEKNHPLQLRAFARFLKEVPECRDSGTQNRVRLVLAGGCRDAGDWERVEKLRGLAAELGLKEGGPAPTSPTGSTPSTPQVLAEGNEWDVKFLINVPLKDMKSLLGKADVGIHTMRDEHFGISVVEFMAAGAVVLAHNSAGPAMDIITPFEGHRTGLLADDEADYARKLKEAFVDLSEEELLAVAGNARRAVLDRFSDESFKAAIADSLIAPLRVSQHKDRAA